MRRPTTNGQVDATEPQGRVMKSIVQFGKELVRVFTDTYHPERHYMRGPGPKWHAKHG